MRRIELVALVAIAGFAFLSPSAGHAATTPPRQDPAHPVTQPAYPSDAFQKGEEGAVVLSFTVRADGTVDPASVTVAESSGSASLDKAAVAEAGGKWRFTPATEDGKPVAAQHMFRVVYEIEEPAAAAKGTTIASQPGLVSVRKKFTPDAKTATDKEQKRDYQEGKVDGVYYRFYDDGSGTFQLNAPGTDPVGAWNLTCGSVGAETLCVARYYKLEVALVKDRGWLVALLGQRMGVCNIAFIPRDKTQEVTALTLENPPAQPAVFPDKDGTGVIKGLMEMDSFVAPCGQDMIADPNMAMRPAPFPVIRRYMEWVLAGQPAG